MGARACIVRTRALAHHVALEDFAASVVLVLMCDTADI